MTCLQLLAKVGKVSKGSQKTITNNLLTKCFKILVS